MVVLCQTPLLTWLSRSALLPKLPLTLCSPLPDWLPLELSWLPLELSWLPLELCWLPLELCWLASWLPLCLWREPKLWNPDSDESLWSWKKSQFYIGRKNYSYLSSAVVGKSYIRKDKFDIRKFSGNLMGGGLLYFCHEGHLEIIRAPPGRGRSGKSRLIFWSLLLSYLIMMMMMMMVIIMMIMRYLKSFGALLWQWWRWWWIYNRGRAFVFDDNDDTDDDDDEYDDGHVTEVLWGTVPLCLWRTRPRPLPVLASKLCTNEDEQLIMMIIWSSKQNQRALWKYEYTGGLGGLWAQTSSWSSFKPLDFGLQVLRALMQISPW